MEKINKLILESGFYQIKKDETYDIMTATWGNVVIFDDSSSDEEIKISLWEGSKLMYFWFFRNNSKILKIRQDSLNSHSELSILNLVKNAKKENRISAIINANGSSSKINILSIIWSLWDMRTDSSITVSKWTKKWIANLKQENILIWDTAKVAWIPALYVHSDDAAATHSMKIEKMKDEDLFYLTSRWIDNSSASAIMLSGKVSSLFSGYAGNKDFLFEALDNFLKK
ncbi:MAG: hypothetical protein ACD_3C00079G0006 [uncultured bacterium (gcode 4)]|uniref:SUF system FeS cluster assembly SufBD core domain-containing protein n=1 Tax=uncultured bacterium (gcode 4) TaxID=1234023 RepID=K2GXX9_9BACT|nr:MAG: hypothetical protein ACD_3C00079G0006 [uncultured bacterium (gcode 4)]